ncbi:AAA family ATPase [Pediococcus pentosaceus]
MAKIARIIIDNLKNVSHGEINLKNKDGYLNVVGLYGQNGSGKTTLIDAVGIYQQLAMGFGLDKKIIDYMNEDRPTRIALRFENEELAFEYSVSLILKNKQVFVISESIEQSRLPNYVYKKDIFSYDFDIDLNEAKINSAIKGVNFNDLELSIIATVKEGKSFIFGSIFNEWMDRNKGKNKYASIIDAFDILKRTAFNLNIHTEEMNGYLATGNIMNLSFAMSQKSGEHTAGVLPIPLQKNVEPEEESFLYSDEDVRLIENIFSKISNVIEKIVPGMKLVVKFRKQTAAHGKGEVSTIEILTQRSGKTIPLRAESLGIQKLVSILALLIEVYNNPDQIVLIDELDSGIFEFLLGELVGIMSEGARGQLIFTSHNLRILETLPNFKIYFSTNDVNDRYVQIKGIRETNNLRDMYIRAVQLNDLEYNLYEGTKTSNIKFAFEDADLSNLSNGKSNSYDDFDFGI